MISQTRSTLNKEELARCLARVCYEVRYAATNPRIDPAFIEDGQTCAVGIRYEELSWKLVDVNALASDWRQTFRAV